MFKQRLEKELKFYLKTQGIAYHQEEAEYIQGDGMECLMFRRYEAIYITGQPEILIWDTTPTTETRTYKVPI